MKTFITDSSMAQLTRTKIEIGGGSCCVGFGHFEKCDDFDDHPNTQSIVAEDAEELAKYFTKLARKLRGETKTL